MFNYYCKFVQNKKMKLSIYKFIFILFVGLAIISCKSDDSNEIEVDPKAENLKALGSSAEDILSDDIYKSLTIELVYSSIYRPTQEAIDNLWAFINARVNKPSGVVFIETMINDQSGAPFNISEIRAIEAENRTIFTVEDDIAIYIYFANGSAQGDTKNSVTLGTAYQNTSIVLYEKTLQTLTVDNPDLLPDLESTVLHHEMGHIFGLVNIQSDDIHTNHEDPDNSRHCIIEECLMYFESLAPTRQIMDQLMRRGGSIPEFDSLCIEDLQAKGGK